VKTVIPVIVALALIASAFAMWSESLGINVTINTGEVKVKFSDWSCSDTGADQQLPGFDNSEGKDVASCSVEPEIYDDDGNPVKLSVVIDNAYPGYTANVSILVDNIGTVPVKLYSINTCYERLPVLVSLLYPEDTQIDPDMNKTFILKVEIPEYYLEEGPEPVLLPENTMFTYHIELTFAQWNEVTEVMPSIGPCD